jgi:hypothetical protein
MRNPEDAVVELLPIDDLDQAIVGLTNQINAATYELLVLVRQFDQRVGWLRWGFDNCADWLHWRCDIGLSAAREKVRVAHALLVLPVISAKFAKGRLAYSKVRALTRVATRDSEEELVAFALGHTTSQVEQRCRELRWGTEASKEQAQIAYARRSLIMHRNQDKGTVTFTVELPTEQAALVDKALDKARESEPEKQAEFANECWSARQADALVEIANTFLNGSDSNPGSISDNYLVTVHVDQKALAEGHGRSGLPIETVKRLCCDGHTVTIVDDENGEPLNIGRKSRTVSTAIKRALRARDKHCRFPGCRNTRYVDAHHVEHWANGGETSLDTLMLICDKHHRLLHEGDYRIIKDYQDKWTFVRPDGIAIPECGYHAEDMTDDDVDDISKAVKHPSREGLLSAVEKPGRSAAPPF